LIIKKSFLLRITTCHLPRKAVQISSWNWAISAATGSGITIFTVKLRLQILVKVGRLCGTFNRGSLKISSKQS